MTNRLETLLLLLSATSSYENAEAPGNGGFIDHVTSSGDTASKIGLRRRWMLYFSARVGYKESFAPL